MFRANEGSYPHDYRNHLLCRGPLYTSDFLDPKHHQKEQKKEVSILFFSQKMGKNSAEKWRILGEINSMEQPENFDEVLSLWRIEGTNLEFSLYDFSQIADATDNFSPNNMLGEGGFGPVYKVFPCFCHVICQYYRILVMAPYKYGMM
jgi:hypothetical protein